MVRRKVELPRRTLKRFLRVNGRSSFASLCPASPKGSKGLGALRPESSVPPQNESVPSSDRITACRQTLKTNEHMLMSVVISNRAEAKFLYTGLTPGLSSK